MVTYMNIPVFTGTKKELLAKLDTAMQSQSKMTVVFTPNPEQVMLALRNTEFLHYLQQSDLNIPDGIGLVWATHVLFGGAGAKERITGRELVIDLTTLAQQQKASMFFLGGNPGTAEQVSKQLSQKYHIACHFDPGAKDIQHETAEEEKRVLLAIDKASPTVLCVAYGAPYQEEWVIAHRTMLEKNGVKIVLVVGGAFDVLSGMIASVPIRFSTLHLEWFWRLLEQPWRWRRQLALISFILLTLKEKLLRTASHS